MANRFSATSAILLLLTMSLTAAPQTPVGSIRASLYDQLGGVIPGATVTVTDQETNVTRQVKSDERGQYAVSNLPPGIYTVTAELAGFVTETQTGTLVRDTSTVVVNLRLNVKVIMCVG